MGKTLKLNFSNLNYSECRWSAIQRRSPPLSLRTIPTPSPARSISSIMSPNNWTLSISLSRHNLIRRLPWPARTMWWMSLLKKRYQIFICPQTTEWKIENLSFAECSFYVPLLPNSEFTYPRQASWESSCVGVIQRLFYAWRLSARFLWLMGRQISIQKSFLSHDWTRLWCIILDFY